MNVPEALRATERATETFRKAVAVASEELADELRRVHSQLLEEQDMAMEDVEEAYAARKRP
jgi:Sec-independent protein translocase protein TatA